MDKITYNDRGEAVDCFAYGRHECTILNKWYNPYEKCCVLNKKMCPFYKSKPCEGGVYIIDKKLANQ